jgi:DNA primase catalytic subunit
VAYNKEKEQQELMLQLQMQLDKLMKNSKQQHNNHQQQQQQKSDEIYMSNEKNMNEFYSMTSLNRDSLVDKNGRIAAERAKTAPNSIVTTNQVKLKL